ncbi:hypothetical protein BY458DRAFT_558256 [Sporodiniella umbellata]|nr:hypothetical protein BY458DRAFT_558256 [Sporodiniella umbellata]
MKPPGAFKDKKENIYTLRDTSNAEENVWITPVKQRRRFSPEESQILEKEYKTNPSPTQEKIQQIATLIDTPRKIVTTWFQNRRAKNKRKEKNKMKEKSDTIQISKPSSSEVYPTKHKVLDPLLVAENPKAEEDFVLQHENSVKSYWKSVQIYNNMPHNTSPRLLSFPEPNVFNQAWRINQNSIGQPSEYPLFDFQQPTSLAFSKEDALEKNEFYPFKESNFHDQKPKEDYFYNAFSKDIFLVSDAPVLHSPYTYVKPTDLLLEYCSGGKPPADSLSQDKTISNDINFSDTINNTAAACYEELMLMPFFDVSLKN